MNSVTCFTRFLCSQNALDEQKISTLWCSLVTSHVAATSSSLSFKPSKDSCRTWPSPSRTWKMEWHYAQSGSSSVQVRVVQSRWEQIGQSVVRLKFQTLKADGLNCSNMLSRHVQSWIFSISLESKNKYNYVAKNIQFLANTGNLCHVFLPESHLGSKGRVRTKCILGAELVDTLSDIRQHSTSNFHAEDTRPMTLACWSGQQLQSSSSWIEYQT